MQAMIAAFEENPSFEKLTECIHKGALPVHIWGLDEAARPLMMEAVKGTSPVRLIVVPDEKTAMDMVRKVSFYDRNVFYYAAKDLLFYYADIHNNTTVRNRINIFKRLSLNEPSVIVTTIEGLMDKLPPLVEFSKNKINISKGGSLDIKRFSKTLTTLGYENVTMVETPGQFSVRGGIVDIYPLTEECPYRVELWGDDIESIRSFDVESQRSIEELRDICIYPSSEMILTDTRINKGLSRIESEYKKQAEKLKGEFRTEQYARLTKTVENIKEELKEFNSTMGLDSMVEYFYDETVSFLDYIDDEALIYVCEPEKVARQASLYTSEFAMSMEGRLLGGYVLPTQSNVIYDGKSIIARLVRRRLVLVSDLYTRQAAWNERDAVGFSTKGLVNYNNSFEALMKDISGFKKKGYRIIIVSPSATRAKRIASNLRDNDIEAHFSEKGENVLKNGQIIVSVGRMETGFEIPDSRLIVISEGDIFTAKEIKKSAKKPKYAGEKITGFADLSVGDYVVHENHGVGIYRGIEKVKTEGRLRDYISVEYAKGSKLFVPIEQLDLIGKLSGKDGVAPKLNRLGGAEWKTTRQRVKGHVDDIARELIDLYAARTTMKGFSYSEDTVWQKEFEELFPYEETIDQQRAIDDTKHDMESDRIMDRLICGDVGFGKTEVAIRAAFKAVSDNRQVAYLVPTTILAEQHFDTFKERMKDFPIGIRMLSRFCTPKEIKETLDDMKSGKADIVIGTHRLLSKDIVFKNLGLLIIDEEQRFGVKHKEKIKQMKKNIDVLTLTATPIPRTLHMSLVGLRDISLLEEPPIDRMPIQTYVMEYDLEFVKEAINRELNRQGQVYYVYNRVNTIEDITGSLKSVLPNARIEAAHGKMNERELENVMRRFIKKEIDVLVSTTIIETGLDIPNVNTIIIHDADKFGLSQLYQLRGRVGRSNRSAYAFLMYKRDKMIKEVAEKRLKAIREYTELGSGYKISMKDLEIRGAGNLLGQEQSGNIAAVGYDLYCKMLNDAIKRLNGEEQKEEFETSIELPVDAYIPDVYVKNEFVKLDLYRRISRCDGREDNEVIIEEVNDRFGEPPKELLRLLEIAYLKSLAKKAYITDVKYIQGELKFFMLPTAPVKTEMIDMLLKRYKGNLKLVTGKQQGFALKSQILIQDELIELAKDTINDIMLLIGG